MSQQLGLSVGSRTFAVRQSAAACIAGLAGNVEVRPVVPPICTLYQVKMPNGTYTDCPKKCVEDLDAGRMMHGK